MDNFRPSRASDLTVQQIQIFCEVFDRGSYAEAARRLGLTPPSLWAQVHLLEQRYGVPLFRKEGRRVVCTPDAERLREAFRPFLAGLESTFDIVGSAARSQPRTIRLVTGMRMALEELAVPLAAFRRRHAEVSLRWLHADNRRSQELVAEGQADLAVMLEPTPERRSPRLEFRSAYCIEYLAVFPARHRLARKSPLRLSDLVAEPLIVGHSETFVRRALDFAMHQRQTKHPLHVVVETDNSALTIACVHKGMGVGIIAGRTGGQLLRGLQVRSLRTTLGEARIVVAWKRGVLLPDTTLELVDAICAT
jgi:DNA-binding transcriptional LysR family regulator